MRDRQDNCTLLQRGKDTEKKLRVEKKKKRKNIIIFLIKK